MRFYTRDKEKKKEEAKNGKRKKIIRENIKDIELIISTEVDQTLMYAQSRNVDRA